MALVESFERISLEKESIHKKVDATYSVIQSNGEIYLQIDTYGSAQRQFPGKKSQSIKLTKTAARELSKIIGETF